MLNKDIIIRRKYLQSSYGDIGDLVQDNVKAQRFSEIYTTRKIKRETIYLVEILEI